MTKDQIIDNEFTPTLATINGISFHEAVSNAMDFYAKQECMAMLKYLADVRGYFDGRVSVDTDEDLKSIYDEFIEEKNK